MITRCLAIFSIVTVGLMIPFPINAQAQEQAPPIDRPVIVRDNLDRITLLSQYQSHTSTVRGINFHPDGTQLYTVGRSGSDFDEMHYFTIESNDLALYDSVVLLPPPSTMLNVQFFNDEDNVMLTTDSGAFIWETQRNIVTSSIVQSLTSSAVNLGSNRVLVASGESGLIALWNITPNIPSQTSDAPPLPDDHVFTPMATLVTATQLGIPISDVSYDPIYRQMFVLGVNGNLYQYAIPAGFILEPPTRLPQPIQESRPESVARASKLIAPDHDGQWVAYAGSYRDVIVYDYMDEQHLLQYPMDSPVICLMTSPDSDILVIGENADEAELIFIETLGFQEIGRVQTEAPIHDCAYSPDGTLIATANPNGDVSLWGIETSP